MRFATYPNTHNSVAAQLDHTGGGRLGDGTRRALVVTSLERLPYPHDGGRRDVGEWRDDAMRRPEAHAQPARAAERGESLDCPSRRRGAPAHHPDNVGVGREAADQLLAEARRTDRLT